MKGKVENGVRVVNRLAIGETEDDSEVGKRLNRGALLPGSASFVPPSSDFIA